MDQVTTEIIADSANTTTNNKQIETLKKHFPQCFDKDGNFIADKMNEIVANNGTALSKESYSLNWLGKSYARLLANEPPLQMLRPLAKLSDIKSIDQTSLIVVGTLCASGLSRLMRFLGLIRKFSSSSQ